MRVGVDAKTSFRQASWGLGDEEGYAKGLSGTVKCPGSFYRGINQRYAREYRRNCFSLPENTSESLPELVREKNEAASLLPSVCW